MNDIKQYITRDRMRSSAGLAALDWMQACYASLNTAYFSAALPGATVALFRDSMADMDAIAHFAVASDGQIIIALAHEFFRRDFPLNVMRYPQLATDMMLHELVHQKIYLSHGLVEGHPLPWVALCQHITTRWGIALDLKQDISRGLLTAWPHFLSRPDFYLGKTSARREGHFDSPRKHLIFKYRFEPRSVTFDILETGA